MYTLRLTLAVVCALAVSSIAYVIPVLYKVPTMNPCTGSSGLEWKPHPIDCSQYFICWGQQHHQLSCGPDTVWQPHAKVCVQKGSHNDICTGTSSSEGGHDVFIPDEEPTSCSYGVKGIITHPRKCAQYYDCSDNTVAPYWEIHLKECDYPMLFNKATHKCEHYTKVSCGSRVEARNPCDYRRNQCARAHCSPCSIRYPDCSGLPDGDNPWKGKEETPQFCACKDGRVVRSDRCPEAQIFDPINRKCVDQVYYFEFKKYAK